MKSQEIKTHSHSCSQPDTQILLNICTRAESYLVHKRLLNTPKNEHSHSSFCDPSDMDVEISSTQLSEAIQNNVF